MSRILGLMGGVASGKSTVARLLEQRGLRLIDADAEARQVVEDAAIQEQLAKRFGHDLFAEGSLDRTLLAKRAFADDASTADLNNIVHPRVRRRLERALEAAQAAGEDVVLDVPLLLESPLSARVTDWIFVQADTPLRDARAANRSWSPAERALREGHQADLERKRARADHLLENDGTIEDLERRVDALLSTLGIPVTPRGPRDREL